MAAHKRKSVSGGMFILASRGVAFFVELASTVILARPLSPNNYCTINMVIAAFAGLFRNLSLFIPTPIQKKTNHRRLECAGNRPA